LAVTNNFRDRKRQKMSSMVRGDKETQNSRQDKKFINILQPKAGLVSLQ